jgi:hypothetical protein
MYTCATAQLESQRTADTKTPGEGGTAAADRTKLPLYYCGIQETPGASEDTRGIQRDTRGTGGHTGNPRDTGRTGGRSWGIRSDTKKTGGNNGGIGTDRKARGIQQLKPPSPATWNQAKSGLK